MLIFSNVEHDLVQAQPIGRSGYAERASVLRDESLRGGARSETTTPDVDERSRNDANHPVKEAISANGYFQDAFVRSRSRDIDAKEPTHCLFTFIGCTTERGEVVFTN